MRTDVCLSFDKTGHEPGLQAWDPVFFPVFSDSPYYCRRAAPSGASLSGLFREAGLHFTDSSDVRTQEAVFVSCLEKVSMRPETWCPEGRYCVRVITVTSQGDSRSMRISPSLATESQSPVVRIILEERETSLVLCGYPVKTALGIDPLRFRSR